METCSRTCIVSSIVLKQMVELVSESGVLDLVTTRTNKKPVAKTQLIKTLLKIQQVPVNGF